MVNTVYIIHPLNDERRALAGMVAVDADESRSFGSPEEFLQAITPDACGCIVAPSDLPGMGMQALIEALRIRGLTLPIVALGHGADIAEAVRLVRAGVTEYLEPPVSRRRLRSVIRRVLVPCRT